jgi:cobalt/nickel transport system permease protein
MHHDYFDRFSRIDSPIHRIPAGIKLAGALFLLLTTVLIPLSRQALFGSIALVLVVIVVASRVPPLFLVRRLLALEFFVVGVAVLSLLQPGGLVIFLRLVARGTLCLTTVLLLSSTTPFAEILRVFRRLRLPAILITTLALMYRYVFVLVDEAERMNRARASRTFRRDRRRAWSVRAGVIGRLFLRSMERAERIYAAMAARGWKT